MVVVDSHASFRDSLVLVARAEGYDARPVDLIPPAHPGEPLLARVLAHRPVLVLTELDLAGSGDGTALVALLAGRGVDVLVLTAGSGRGRVGAALDAGARAVLPKSAPLAEVLDVVERILRGEHTTTTDRAHLVSEYLQTRLRERTSWRRLSLLSARETQTLRALLHGLDPGGIAASWAVPEAAVRAHVHAVLDKLEVSSAVAAVRVAREAGWAVHG